MLLEGVLAEEFGVSRTPVRQALQRLTYEGLIEVRTGVGSVVSPLEPAQRNMHFLVHHELLGLVARFPDEPIPSQIARRLDMIHAQGSSGRSADIESLYALFTEFNALLSQMIPDPIIADAHLISGWRIVRWLLADVQTGQGRLVTGAFDRIWTMCRDTGNGKAAFFPRSVAAHTFQKGLIHGFGATRGRGSASSDRAHPKWFPAADRIDPEPPDRKRRRYRPPPKRAQPQPRRLKGEMRAGRFREGRRSPVCRSRSRTARHRIVPHNQPSRLCHDPAPPTSAPNSQRKMSILSEIYA